MRRYLTGLLAGSLQHPDRRLDPPGARLRLPGLFDGLDVLSLVAVAEHVPLLAGPTRGPESAAQISRRGDLALVRVEIQAHVDRLAAFETGRFAIRLPQRHAGRPAHRGDRAPVRVAVERHLDGCAHPAEDLLRIEGQRDEAHRAIP